MVSYEQALKARTHLAQRLRSRDDVAGLAVIRDGAGWGAKVYMLANLATDSATPVPPVIDGVQISVETMHGYAAVR